MRNTLGTRALQVSWCLLALPWSACSEPSAEPPVGPNESALELQHEPVPAGSHAGEEAQHEPARKHPALVPALSCVEPGESGELRAHWGYANQSAVAVTSEIGVRNRFTPGAANRGQPVRFEPGTWRDVLMVSFPANAALTWALEGTQVTANRRSRRCEPNAAGGGGTGGDHAEAGHGVAGSTAGSAAGSGGVAGLAGAGGSGGSAAGSGGSSGACSSRPCRLALAPASNRVDMVHDAKRGYVYITTSETSGAAGAVLRWDMVHGKFVEPLLTGGSFFGVDISPSQDVLVVADAKFDATNNWVYLIDLNTGSARQVKFRIDGYEGGTFMPLFVDETTVFVTSTFQGSGWVPLRKLSLVDDHVETLYSVRQDTMLAASADRSTVAWAEANISNGPITWYDVATAQTVGGAATGWFTYEVCLARDASQIATPTYGGLFVFDRSAQQLGLLGTYASVLPVGCVYSPVDDLVYFAWTDYDGAHASVDAYSTTSLTPVQTIEPSAGLIGWNGNWAFGGGRMRISLDGAWLFVTLAGGVGIYGVR